MQPPSDNPEFGRELQITELQEKTVVWITREDRPSFATMWVYDIHPEMITFLAGDAGMLLGTFRRGDQLQDETGNRIRVYQYLGEI